MTQPSFHSPGVYVPTHLIFHPELPASVLVTWIQLRSLTIDGRVTPPATLPELAARLGIHPSRLNRHMAYLQDLDALSSHEVGGGKIALSFPDQPSILPNQPTSVQAEKNPPLRVIQNPDSSSASYFPSRILGYLSFDDDKDPLLIEREPENIHERHLPEAHHLSEFLTRQSAEHALVEK